ncbi:MAG: hypothetical protein FWF31_11760 [Desulfobulbus sp.]|nr:hypothetical protein [Desulfobulbus sp.]
MNRFVPGSALFPLIGLLLLTLVGCSAKQSKSQPAPQEISPSAVAAPSHVGEGIPEAAEADKQQSSYFDPAKLHRSERDRAACYHYQPATTTVVKRQVPAKNSKSAHGAKKDAENTAKAPMVTETKVVRTGRCQPQCLIYARCRTGFTSCRLGDTSPVQWFACAAKNKDTTSHPHTGSIMVLAAHAGHNMATGHLVYVEETKKHKNGTWQIRVSHTNYDRKCHLDQDAMVLFDPKQMTTTFETGPWAPWAKNLKTLGFILR